jgi:hypothetical protein
LKYAYLTDGQKGCQFGLRRWCAAYITITFSYAYLNRFECLMVSSPCVHIIVQRLNRAISPRMIEHTGYVNSISLTKILHDLLFMSTVSAMSSACALSLYAQHSTSQFLCPALAVGIHRRMDSCSFSRFARQLHPLSSHRVRHGTIV